MGGKISFKVDCNVLNEDYTYTVHNCVYNRRRRKKWKNKKSIHCTYTFSSQWEKNVVCIEWEVYSVYIPYTYIYLFCVCFSRKVPHPFLRAMVNDLLFSFFFFFFCPFPPSLFPSRRFCSFFYTCVNINRWHEFRPYPVTFPPPFAPPATRTYCYGECFEPESGRTWNDTRGTVRIAYTWWTFELARDQSSVVDMTADLRYIYNIYMYVLHCLIIFFQTVNLTPLFPPTTILIHTLQSIIAFYHILL